MLDREDKAGTRAVFFRSHKIKIPGVFGSKRFVLQSLDFLFEEFGQTMSNQIHIARA